MAEANIIDSTGNGHTGTNSGSTSVGGKVGDCRSFDGINDSISVANHTDFSGLNACTVEIWLSRPLPG